MKKKDYIVVRVFGGMGNQLWQYSFGRALAIKYKKRLVLDVSFFKNPFVDYPKGDRFKFELGKFKLHKDVIIEKNLYEYSYRFFKYFLNYLPNFLINHFLNNKQKYKIKRFIFEDKLFKKIKFKNISSEKSFYFLGYWQNKNYFENYHINIKNELRPKVIKKKVLNFIKNIKKNEVAIHIRGGDMVIEKHYSHPSSEYYSKIINYFENKKSLKFHIFTDDYNYANRFLKKINLENYLIVSRSFKFSDVEEFYIMQHYKYFAINRSTFSWWAGYLSDKKNSKIFVPKIWQNNLPLPKSLQSKNMILL